MATKRSLEQRISNMSKKTSISWTDHTFNPWIGCTKVSAECRQTYRFRKTDVASTATTATTATAGWNQAARTSRQASPLSGAARRVLANIRRAHLVTDIFFQWVSPVQWSTEDPHKALSYSAAKKRDEISTDLRSVATPPNSCEIKLIFYKNHLACGCFWLIHPLETAI